MKRSWGGLWLAAFAAVGLGCGTSSPDERESSGGGISASAGGTTGGTESGTGGPGGSTDGSESASASTSSTTDPTLGTGSSGEQSTSTGEVSEESGDTTTTGPVIETTGGVATRCTAVDFLFIVDNSVSMGNEQEALVAAFPGFMSAIETTLEAGSDYHIMVLDTDDWGRCDTANPWDGATPTHSTCNGYVESTVFDECDGLIGAGVLHPAGEGASNQLCTPASGKRYIEEGEPDLSGTFACMATVGLAGHANERPMDAMVAALDPMNAAVQACNDEFLRDDALLVITFISDDPNMPDAGTPAEWYQSVVAAKGGNEEAVVVLGLGPGGDGCGAGGEHWLEFVELWGDNGIHGPVCGTADDYIEFFQNSVATIDQACEDIVPG